MTEKRRTRTRDLNTLAASILRQATGEEPKRPPPEAEARKEPKTKPKKPTR